MKQYESKAQLKSRSLALCYFLLSIYENIPVSLKLCVSLQSCAWLSLQRFKHP